MRRRSLACLLVVGIAVALTAPLVAQQPQAPPGQDQFVPLKDLKQQDVPSQENLPAAPLVMGAYAFVWVTLIVYVWLLARRLARVQGEIEQLRRRASVKGRE